MRKEVIHINNNQKRKEFFSLYNQFRKLKSIDNDLISLGNLAIFTDYYCNSTSWERIKREIILQLQKGSIQNAYYLVVNGIYKVFEFKEKSYLVVDKYNECKREYYKGRLYSMNIIRDKDFFPYWLLEIYKYTEFLSKEEVYSEIYKLANRHENFKVALSKQHNKLGLAYFIDNFFETPEWLELISFLIDSINRKDLNEFSWIIYKNCHDKYMEDLYEIKNDKHLRNEVDIAKFLGMAETFYRFNENMYKKKELFFFDIIPEALCKYFKIDWLKE